jgi:hypothetical protein
VQHVGATVSLPPEFMAKLRGGEQGSHPGCEPRPSQRRNHCRTYSTTPPTCRLCSWVMAHHPTTSLRQPRMPGSLGNHCVLPLGNINSCLEYATRGTAKLAKVHRLFPLAARSRTWWRGAPAIVWRRRLQIPGWQDSSMIRRLSSHEYWSFFDVGAGEAGVWGVY